MPGPGRRFQKGQSGNPGGKPKGLATKVRELAPAEDLAAWCWAIWTKSEVQLATLGIDPDACTLAERNKAHQWLTERGYGKAPEHAPVEGENPLELDSLDQEIAGILDELAERRKTPPASAGEDGSVASTG